MSTGFRRTAARPTTDSGRADGVVERTIRSLESGMSVGEVARASNLPRDFIEQIAVFARERGRLDFVSVSADSGCGTGSCTPDPDSIICASCPLAPPAAKRGHTPLAHIASTVRNAFGRNKRS